MTENRYTITARRKTPTLSIESVSLRRVVAILLLTFWGSIPLASAQKTYRDASLTTAERVDDLMTRMTPEEKFWQLFMIPASDDEPMDRYEAGIFGFQFSSGGSDEAAVGQMLDHDPGQRAREAAIRINDAQRWFVEESRLGIPIIPFDEALHGLVRSGATAFPQAVALAATFDTTLVGDVAAAIAAETRSRGIRQILSPVLNIARDPRWGRVEETYGEDPVLTSAMGVAFIGALERAGIVATPKHFVANVGDGGRDSYPISFSERTLEEVYFPAFRDAVREAGARSIMTAYNSVDGAPASASTWLLTRKLTDEWGFDGFVISDAGGTGGANVLHFTAADYAEATKRALEAGLDVIFQTSYDHFGLFWAAVEQGLVDMEAIDRAVRRVLTVKFDLGLFEQPYVDPAQAARLGGHPDHRALARRAAEQSMVLLKNDGATLPLDPGARIAVIGRDATEARLGGYSGPGNDVVSGLRGIRARTNDVTWHEGVPRTSEDLVVVPTSALRTPEGQPGLKATFWTNTTLEGDPALTRTDARVDAAWTLFGPAPELAFDWYSVRWSGTLHPPATGKVRLGVRGNDGYRLWLGDSLLIDNWRKQAVRTRLANIHLEDGRPVDLRLEYRETTGGARVQLVWDLGVTDDTEPAITEAAQAARNADVAIVFAGIEEGEFRDRAKLGLPGRQSDLIRAVAATGTPTVVVLIGGSAITMSDWIDDVDAVLMAWYPGEAGGEALTRILYGDASPAGRLPITFPVAEGQLPLFYGHKPTGRGDDYLDLSGRPLFPFGFGLSYTTFAYANLEIAPATIDPQSRASIQFTLTNSGPAAGDEVVQLYLRDELASVAQPVQALKAFQRVHLAPGASRRISFDLGPEELSLLDANLNRIVEPGRFRIMIGGSSTDIRLRGFLDVHP